MSNFPDRQILRPVLSAIERPGRFETIKPTILIVEDHKGMRFLLYNFLSESFPHCGFLEAKTGEEAVALACAQSPKIILMDIGLPQMNGIEATRRIKDALPQTQVVIVTNHEEAEFRREAVAAGAFAYVLKDRMYTELIPVLTRLCSNQK